jgi:hypothetical protein
MARKPKSGADAADLPPEAEGIDSALIAEVEATDPATAREAEPPRADTAPPVTQATTAPSGGSGGRAFAGMVLGGALVFAAGFGVARFMPDLLPMPAETDAAALEPRLAAVEERLAALPAPDATLADRIAALESAPPAAPADTAALETRLADLESRLAALADAPASGVDGAALAQLREQVAALQAGGPASAQATALATEAEARLAEVRAAADALRAETEAAAAATRRAAALTRLSAALESGAPFAAALADLGGDVPPVLSGAAEAGLPALSALQDSFPQAARAALDAAIHADMGASWTERVGNFLKVQSGARSLEPREGDDPDAILSRAEAALAAGDVQGALDQIAALPAPAQEAMAGWTAAATLRIEAAKAIATLAAQG